MRSAYSPEKNLGVRKVSKSSFVVLSPEKEKQDRLLLKGEVMRYRPTFSNHALFIGRHLQLTESIIKYFGRSHDNFPNSEPLFRIPLNQIQEACWVDISGNTEVKKKLGTENLINKIA